MKYVILMFLIIVGTICGGALLAEDTSPTRQVSTGRITCFSGGKKIFDDYSSALGSGLHTIHLVSATTGETIYVKGDCIYIDNAVKPEGFVSYRASE